MVLRQSIASFNGDLSSLTAPPFILSSTSLVEYSAYWAEHPSLFVAPAQEPDPEKRALAVLKWFLSSLKSQQYAGRDPNEGIKKPLNAFLGEIFVGECGPAEDPCKLVSEQDQGQNSQRCVQNRLLAFGRPLPRFLFKFIDAQSASVFLQHWLVRVFGSLHTLAIYVLYVMNLPALSDHLRLEHAETTLRNLGFWHLTRDGSILPLIGLLILVPPPPLPLPLPPW